MLFRYKQAEAIITFITTQI